MAKGQKMNQNQNLKATRLSDFLEGWDDQEFTAVRAVDMSVSGILSAAADYVDDNGWTQEIHKDDHKSDLMFSVCRIIGDHPTPEDALKMLQAWRFLRLVLNVTDLQRWNDASGRRQSHVIDALKKASSLAKREGF